MNGEHRTKLEVCKTLFHVQTFALTGSMNGLSKKKKNKISDNSSVQQQEASVQHAGNKVASFHLFLQDKNEF